MHYNLNPIYLNYPYSIERIEQMKKQLYEMTGLSNENGSYAFMEFECQ